MQTAHPDDRAAPIYDRAGSPRRPATARRSLPRNRAARAWLPTRLSLTHQELAAGSGRTIASPALPAPLRSKRVMNRPSFNGRSDGAVRPSNSPPSTPQTDGLDNRTRPGRGAALLPDWPLSRRAAVPRSPWRCRRGAGPRIHVTTGIPVAEAEHLQCAEGMAIAHTGSDL